MSTGCASVGVTMAGLAEKVLFAHLAQFYVYDFSELEPDESPRFAFDEDGRLQPLPGFDAYWSDVGCHPLLIRVDGAPAGFALINNHSHRGGAVERNMGEFFVARKYRRRGVAREAVRRVLSLYPGRWEVAVTERNAAALAFWPLAIAAAPNVSGLARVEGDGTHWRGPIWTFTAS